MKKKKRNYKDWWEEIDEQCDVCSECVSYDEDMRLWCLLAEEETNDNGHCDNFKSYQ
ncbi:unnamed protein product [marine sediment metagenome]|uniref:Uncharacterized protein n=1 Tax=marine sediment metagenome TaxID=412755 RepID=X0SZ85_9ZZZZ